MVMHLSLDSLQSGNNGTVVLKSTYVNQDGRSSSLTAPNGPSQQDVIRGALKGAQAAPKVVSGQVY